MASRRPFFRMATRRPLSGSKLLGVRELLESLTSVPLSNAAPVIVQIDTMSGVNDYVTTILILGAAEVNLYVLCHMTHSR